MRSSVSAIFFLCPLVSLVPADVTRSAISQHLKVLLDSGLVQVRRDGTRHLYTARPEGIEEVREFLDQFWDDSLQQLKRAAEADERGLSVDEGVLVQFVGDGGPASNAGIEVNDVIVQVDGKPVATTSALVRLFLTDYAIGDTVTVTIVRAAVTLTFEMVLAKVEP